MTDDDDNVIQFEEFFNPETDTMMTIDSLVESYMCDFMKELYSTGQFDIDNHQFKRDFAIMLLFAKSMLLRNTGRYHKFQDLADQHIYIPGYDQEQEDNS